VIVLDRGVEVVGVKGGLDQARKVKVRGGGGFLLLLVLLL